MDAAGVYNAATVNLGLSAVDFVKSRIQNRVWSRSLVTRAELARRGTGRLSGEPVPVREIVMAAAIRVVLNFTINFHV